MLASLANYEFCLYRRRLEKAYMQRAVEIIDRKKAEKLKEAQTRREEAQKAKIEADKLADTKKSWKFW
jgi:cytochrome c oxidase assembly protein subunit 20